MSDSKQIMVAVDFSDYALPSVRYAAHLARKLGEGLLLVNAINRRDVDMMKSVAAAYPGFVVETYLAENRKDRTALMEKLIAGANCEGLQVDIEIRVGVPYEVLLEVIDEKDPEMLVMASKGRTNLADAVVGSCAQKIFRRCPIPLVILRTPR
jgi:nucleotide-binding universal stress UspA family protein